MLRKMRASGFSEAWEFASDIAKSIVLGMRSNRQSGRKPEEAQGTRERCRSRRVTQNPKAVMKNLFHFLSSKELYSMAILNLR